MQHADKQINFRTNRETETQRQRNRETDTDRETDLQARSLEECDISCIMCADIHNKHRRNGTTGHDAQWYIQTRIFACFLGRAAAAAAQQLVETRFAHNLILGALQFPPAACVCYSPHTPASICYRNPMAKHGIFIVWVLYGSTQLDVGNNKLRSKHTQLVRIGALPWHLSLFPLLHYVRFGYENTPSDVRVMSNEYAVKTCSACK